MDRTGRGATAPADSDQIGRSLLLRDPAAEDAAAQHARKESIAAHCQAGDVRVDQSRADLFPESSFVLGHIDAKE